MKRRHIAHRRLLVATHTHVSLASLAFSWIGRQVLGVGRYRSLLFAYYDEKRGTRRLDDQGENESERISNEDLKSSRQGCKARAKMADDVDLRPQLLFQP